MPPRKDSQTLDHLLHQMDLAFTNVTGQTISFIDQSGSWHGPLRLERFTQFCRCVMDSPEGAARCRACNHTMGLRAGDGVVVECCHMGVSVISMPVPVEEELKRLASATGVNVYPQKPNKAFDVNGESYRMSGKEYETFAITQGQTSYDLLTTITSDPIYAGLPDAQKAELVKDVYSFAAIVARKTASDSISPRSSNGE